MPDTATAGKGARPVSPGNPCPFLRALVAQGQLPDGDVPLGQITQTIVRVAQAGDGEPELPAAAIRAIALIANGLGPLRLVHNAASGVRLAALRGGPLDKQGSGSRILDRHADVDTAQLARLDDFAGDKTDADGQVERGLDAQDLARMMDANFERAADHRRRIDRRLMEGEWPILLKVMGKEGPAGRYLSLADLRRLFVDRKLPQRMLQRLGAK
jgi:hypothetical protein